METAVNKEADTVHKSPVDQNSVYRGLLYKEWLQHGKMLKTFAAVWLICLYAILLFNHPGWIIGFGMLLASVAGMRLGGADAAEGSEEFAFTLPVYRKEYFIVRAVLGLTFVLGLCGLGVISIALDLPQVFWGLIVDSGFTEPFPEVQYSFVYWLAIILPFAVFAFSFSMASLGWSQRYVANSTLVGLVGAGGLCLMTLAAEKFLNSPERIEGGTGVPDGMICIPLLMILGISAFAGSRVFYLRKNGINRTVPFAGKAPWITLLLIVIVLFIILAMFLGSVRG